MKIFGIFFSRKNYEIIFNEKGYIFPEFNNCTPPKWRKKAQVEEGIQKLLVDYRNKFTIKNKTKMKESQKEFWSKLENQEYLENYRQSMKNKRTDEPKKISDRHWGELYNLTLEKESPDKGRFLIRN